LGLDWKNIGKKSDSLRMHPQIYVPLNIHTENVLAEHPIVGAYRTYSYDISFT